MLSSFCRSIIIVFVTGATCSLLLQGCAAVDRYSARSVVYNEEASQSRTSAIVLNVVRAAHRYPLQFTDLSTISGTASASGTLGTTLPVRIGGTRFADPNLLPIGGSGTFSGGPTFNVANLNNQEFYQGIQTPIEEQIIANYLKSGVPMKLLLQLFISEIEIEDPAANKRVVIVNTADTLSAYNNFLTTIDALVENGLYLGAKDSSSPVGPVLSNTQARDPRFLSSIVASTSADGTQLKLTKIAGRDAFQLVKPGGGWRFCFNEVLKHSYAQSGTLVSSLRPATSKSITLTYANGRPSHQLTNPERCNSKTPEIATEKPKPARNMRLTSRSVEQIIAYLGELARLELGLDGREPQPLVDPNGGPAAKFSPRAPGAAPETLFRVRRGIAGNHAVAAAFQGMSYSVAIDPSGADASGQVLQIVSDLLALKSSAKALPAPNLISVVQ